MPSRLRRQLTLAASGLLAGAALARAAGGSSLRAHQLGLAASAIFLVPTLLRNCSWYGPVTNHYHTEEKQVALTIDDGPDPQDTPEILDVLAHHQAQAVFFHIGQKVVRHPDLVRAVVEGGHSIQNHTWSHPRASFWATTPAGARRQIIRASQAIRQTSGQAPHLFRAPAGLANPFVHTAAEKAGLRLTGWSASGNDGLPHHPQRVIARILRDIRPGGIILLHEGPLAGLAPGTRARTLAGVLQGLDQRGYRVGSLL